MAFQRLTRKYVERKWIPSIGDHPNAEHFREPPPGTRHAVCKPRATYCLVHKDQYNPHAGILDAIGHFLEWSGAPILIGLIGLTASLFAVKNQSVCPICGAITGFNPQPGFYYQCEKCMSWFSTVQ
jgi:hypothetical protein